VTATVGEEGRVADLNWKKSMASASSNCVEVADDSKSIYVRDSKDPAGPVLAFTKTEWKAFLAGVRAGEFDSPS
jgi:predicted secreted Zn-dependent protease